MNHCSLSITQYTRYRNIYVKVLRIGLPLPYIILLSVFKVIKILLFRKKVVTRIRKKNDNMKTRENTLRRRNIIISQTKHQKQQNTIYNAQVIQRRGARSISSLFLREIILHFTNVSYIACYHFFLARFLLLLLAFHPPTGITLLEIKRKKHFIRFSCSSYTGVGNYSRKDANHKISFITAILHIDI